MISYSRSIAVSLVDDAFICTMADRAKPLVLPSYVAIQTGTENLLAYGEEAKSMQGREPENITVIRVLEEGRISNLSYAVKLLKLGIKQLLGTLPFLKPKVIIASRTEESDKWTLKELGIQSGAREVYLVEIGMATAIGMQLDVQKPEIKAALSISDDWFEFSVISLAGVLARSRGSIGSRSFVEDIQNHCSLCKGFKPDADSLTARIESEGINPGLVAELQGWETWAGRSELGRRTSASITKDDLSVGMMPSLIKMTERIKTAIRSLPESNQSELSRGTIHVTGSACKIPGLAQMISDQLGFSVTPSHSEVHPSIEGCKLILHELKILKNNKPAKKPQ